MNLECECSPSSPEWNRPHIVLSVDAEEADATVFAVYAAHPVFAASREHIERYAAEVEGVEVLHVEVLAFATPDQTAASVNTILASIEED